MIAEEEEEEAKGQRRLLPLRRSVFIPPSTHPLSTLVGLLQRCADQLHIGPYGLLSASVSVDAQLLLLRPRAVDILQGTAELEAWKVLWGLFFTETPTLHTAASVAEARRGKGYSLPDGHGRLLVISASLLRRFVAPGAKYPVRDTSSATRNRRCLIRVLQQLITPGELEGVFPIAAQDDPLVQTHTDLIGRMTLASLREVQPYFHSVGATVARHVLEGCIHYTMCTEVEGDVLITLRSLLFCFLCNSPIPKGRVNTQSVVRRARTLLTDPFLCITSCVGGSVCASRSLPCGTFVLPTTSSTLAVHEGTRTPFFALGNGEAEEGPLLVLLLRIDDKGGLLDFPHSKVENKSDGESEGWDEEGQEGIREVHRTWTLSEQDEAQLEAARILYTWAWNNNVRVILTPSYVPPVIKTYGQRYNAEGITIGTDSVCSTARTNKSTTGTNKNSSIFMVDEVDETSFDALLRRLQYWRCDSNDRYGKLEMFSSLDVAVLRRGKLELPDCLDDVLLPVERIMHHSLNTLFRSFILRGGVTKREDDSLTVVSFELSKHKPHDVLRQDTQDLEGMGSMFLVACNSNLIAAYKALILKSTVSVLTALDASLFSGAINSEFEFGFVRAGGALSIALARLMRRCAKTLKQSRCSVKDTAVRFPALSHSTTPVVAAVLELLSEALLEVPRHLATHITAHHYPLRRGWWRLEADEMQFDPVQMLHSLTPAHETPLHVYIREDPTYYRRMMNPRLSQVEEEEEEEEEECDDAARKYFCCSDTESSWSEPESEDSFHQEERNDSNGVSFVEPVAVTTSVLRAAMSFVRLILTCEDNASDAVGI